MKIPAIDKLEKVNKLPCGPMDIAHDSICRKSLPTGLDRLLDRLSMEIDADKPHSETGNSKIIQDSSGEMVPFR